MDVRLSPEQHALRDSVAQVMARLGPRAVGQLDDAERMAKLNAAVAASGWRELRAPSDDGMPWASAVEAAIVAEELGRGLADVPFLGPTLATELRRLAAAPAASGPETVVLGTGLGALACADSGATPAGAVAVDAREISSALVVVPTPGGYELGQVAVERTGPELDLTRPAATVTSSAPVEPVADQGRPITDAELDRWTALGLALSCADLVGTMRGAIDLACGYAKERRQYGVPIGSFQAIQHLLADAFVAMEGSRSVALHAAWAVDALAPPAARAAGALAKAYCSRAARGVCETTIQVHGGIGNTWECLAHVYLRRALLSIDVLGGVGPSLARVVDHHVGGTHGLR